MGLRAAMVCLTISTGCWILVDALESRSPFSFRGAYPEGAPEHRCDPVFGLETPGRTARPFAPERFAREGFRLHGALAISPDRDRMCWSVVPPAIMCIECDNGIWSAPRRLPLPGAAVQAPSFSADGRRLFYQAGGPGSLGSIDIWWVDVKRRDWSNPVNLGVPVNGPGLQSQPTATDSGDLYFSGAMEGVEFGRGIYHAVQTESGFGKPVALNPSINTPGIDYCPFVSADGDTLLFASNRGHAGEELYVHAAFRTPDGGWTEPVDLHPLMDHPQTARFPSMSPDGRILFFLSGGQFWWVDATVLDSARSRTENDRAGRPSE